MMLRTIQPQRLLRSLALLQQPVRKELCRPRKTDQIRWKSTTNNNNIKKVLSRKERRRLEREAKKDATKNKNVAGTEEVAKKSWSFDSIRNRAIRLIPNPRIPGGARGLFHKTHRTQLAARVSALLVIAYVMESQEVSPISLDMAQGPSMLPTFATVGDIYLRATGVWSRLLGLPIKYERGDLIVFEDANGRYAGKRIIGVEGDEVLRYGEYVHLYQDRPDWGITKSEQMPDFEGEVEWDAATRRFKVPPNHVWLEGDFPPLSLDSRHYGPISVDWIRGRILGRVWPLKGGNVSKSRPEPLPVKEALSGKYNLHLHPMLRKAKEESSLA